MEKDELEKVIKIISTHDEGDGAYCDTGEDMEWACRSECVDKAIARLRKHLRREEENGNNNWTSITDKDNG